MKPLLLFLGFATLGNILYHVGQKSVAANSNPLMVLMASYALAFTLSAIAAPWFSAGAGAPGVVAQMTQPAVWVIGAGIFMMEAGFLLAYRSGGSIQWAGVAVNTAGAVVLVPLAIWCFRENINPVKITGLVLCLTGLALLTRK